MGLRVLIMACFYILGPIRTKKVFSLPNGGATPDLENTVIPPSANCPLTIRIHTKSKYRCFSNWVIWQHFMFSAQYVQKIKSWKTHNVMFSTSISSNGVIWGHFWKFEKKLVKKSIRAQYVQIQVPVLLKLSKLATFYVLDPIRTKIS